MTYISPLKIMLDAYIEAIYFTETGDEGQPPSDAELTDISRMRSYQACADFILATEELGVKDFDWVQAGHDLWLTRNGHGTGFWDRDSTVYGWLGGIELKTIFTAIAIAIGEHYVEFKE